MKVVYGIGWGYDFLLFDNAIDAVNHGMEQWANSRAGRDGYYELDERSIATVEDIRAGRSDVTGVLPQTFVRRFKPNGWTDAAFRLQAVKEWKP